MVTYKPKAFINLILILIINKLILLAILATLEKLHIYKLIFDNMKSYYDKHKSLQSQLLKFINQSNQQLVDNLEYKFLADDLSLDCNQGINIYKISLPNDLYANIAKRTTKVLNEKTLQQTTFLNNLILQKYSSDSKAITIIDFFGKNVADEVFFIKNNLLYRYNINKDLVFSYNVHTNIIDYIVGSYLNINQEHQYKYHIYLRCREPNNINDTIKTISIKPNNTLVIQELLSIPKANNFFLKSNHLIFLYNDCEPQIYKIFNNKELNLKKININFSTKINDYSQTTKNPKCQLYWDDYKQTHIATTLLNSYEFTLAEDNGILSIKIISN